MELMQQIFCFILWLFVIPMMIGVMPSFVLERRQKTFSTIYLSGWLVMGAVFQAIAVPFVMNKKSLTELIFTYSAILGIIVVGGLLFYIIGILHDGLDEFFCLPDWKGLKKDGLYWGLFLMLLLFQMVMSICMMSPDGDDAYYVVHAVIADQKDTMYLQNAYTGWHGALDARHVLAPFSMFYAMLARNSGISATIVAHTIMPPVLILLTYLIYYKIAQQLFPKNQSQVPVFMVLISLIQLFGNTSVYTNETFFLTRTWQGKSILANIALPGALLIMFMISRKTEKKIIEHNSVVAGWFVMLFFINLVGALASSLGLLLLAILEGVCGVLIAVRNKRFWILPATIGAMLPCALFMVLYVLM